VGGQHSGYVTWEQVVAFDPEVLLMSPCGFDLARSLIEARILPRLPDYHKLAAVQSGRVFVIDGNAYLNRSGPRIVDSLEILAHLLHPGMFGPPQDLPAGCQPWQSLA
jgi:iron complex transport system substrate-binding protein